jgi:fido (protein-threonine AMPylation protein)
MSSGHKWRPIEDLPDSMNNSSGSESKALATVWADVQAAMEPDQLEELLRRIRREWSIETGMVEDIYRWDRGVTETLIAGGIRADRIPSQGNILSPEQIAQVLNAQLQVVDGLFPVIKQERPLSKSYIHEIHAALLEHQETYAVHTSIGVQSQELKKGVYKRYPNSVQLDTGARHEYCPPESVESEMDRLVGIAAAQVERRVPADIRAAWLHHAFSQIHPYPDGNGRVARTLATVVLVQSGLFPFIVRNSEKSDYYAQLQNADAGNLEGFSEFLRRTQRRTLIFASQSAIPPLPPLAGDAAMHEIIARAQRKLIEKGQIHSPAWAQSGEKVGALVRLIGGKLQSLADQLQVTVGRYGDASFLTGSQGQAPGELAGNPDLISDYTPDFSESSRTQVLVLKTGRQFELAINIHSTNRPHRGLFGCIGCLIDKESGTVVPGSVSDYFLITYAEDTSHLHSRFEPWLEATLKKALSVWQEQL